MTDRSIIEVLDDLDLGLSQDQMELDLGYQASDLDPRYIAAATRALAGVPDALLREKLTVILALRQYEKDHEED